MGIRVAVCPGPRAGCYNGADFRKEGLLLVRNVQNEDSPHSRGGSLLSLEVGGLLAVNEKSVQMPL